MLNQFSRTQMLIGLDNIDKLKNSRVAVFGIGGVGGYVVEGLVRAGVQNFDLIDDDKVCLTNLNRQLIATRNTVGKYKVDVMKERILSINPEANVSCHKCFYLPDSSDEIDFSQYSYIVDAIDTVTGKLEIVMQANKYKTPIISCLGTGNRIDPEKLHITDIFQTSMCPLAKVMRKELRRRNIEKLQVLYSSEIPIKPIEDMASSCKSHCICPPGAKHKCTHKRAIPGSISFVPSVAGMMIAGKVTRDLINYYES